MKKFYDKLLFLLAVLALSGGVVFYVLKTGDTGVERPGPALEPAEHPYAAIPIPETAAITVEWPEPGPQSSGPEWLYDVFTPPKIYLDKEGRFTAVPPKVLVVGQPFGIYLDEILRKPYRIQIQGFSGDRTKPKECVLFFFDEERQTRFFIRPGEANQEAELEVLDFTIDREIDENNVVSVTAVATIKDNRSGETVRLVDGERLFESKITVVFRSREDPEVMVRVHQAGDTFETPLGRYTLKEINLEDQSVRVEKHATEDSEVETRTLLVEAVIEPLNTPQSETPDEESPPEQGFFPSIFE